ncbi:hypothetical protein [Streptomyces thermocarboxydovorans]|uniref:hypothetical protein n=1 Tax=Streptomyces thermocarboxydovorans TaxID=59298 RepID=UPI0031E438F3
MSQSSPHPITPKPAFQLPAADHDRRAWVAPAVATALLFFLGPAALFFGGLSPMATDACGPDNCSQALMTRLTLIEGTMFYGGLLTSGAWVTSWVLPWTHRWSMWRALAAALSLMPSLFVLMLVMSLPQG